jgi:hypothetical protein
VQQAVDVFGWFGFVAMRGQQLGAVANRRLYGWYKGHNMLRQLHGRSPRSGARSFSIACGATSNLSHINGVQAGAALRYAQSTLARQRYGCAGGAASPSRQARRP